MRQFNIVLILSVSLLCGLSVVTYFYVNKQTFQDGPIIAQHKKFIRMTLDDAKDAIDIRGDLPFAAILVNRDGRVLHKAKNAVNSKGNLIRHAELVLLDKIDQSKPDMYRGSILYVNTEPCPMCTAAVDRMKNYVDKIVYGCSAKTLTKYIKSSRNVLPSEKLLQLMGSTVKVEGPVLESEAELIHKHYWASK